jgi:hypothetical protein
MNPPNSEGTDARDPLSRDINPDLLRAQLEELGERESGIGFIYAALDLLAERWALKDAVIVLANESFGSQIFRSGARRVGGELIAQLDGHPGLYTWPENVPRAESDVVYLACQQAFTLHMLRFAATHDPDVSPSEVSGKAALGPTPDTRIASSGQRQSTRVRTNHQSERVSGNNRRLFSVVLLISDITIFALSIGGVHGSLRYTLGLVLGIVIPGWSIVGLLKLNNVALEISLTLALSLALVMIAAQILITINEWHPIALEQVTCVLCFPSLYRQSHFQRRR